MNRFVRGAAAAALVAGGLGSVGCTSTGGSVARGVAPGGCGAGDCAGGGCAGGGASHGDGAILRTYYDPCYPERYNAAARQEVLAPFAAQANNGHVLNQTIWNWYFEPGTDKLTTAGYAKLDSIVQTRPGPDCRLYLQAARDINVNPENLDKVGAMRDELTAKRAAMVQRYMASQPNINPVAYEIFVHDPVVPSIRADFALNSFRMQTMGYRGGIGGASGSTAPGGGGGGAPAASAVGGGAVGGAGAAGGQYAAPTPAPGTVGPGQSGVGPGM